MRGHITAKRARTYRLPLPEPLRADKAGDAPRPSAGGGPPALATAGGESGAALRAARPPVMLEPAGFTTSRPAAITAVTSGAGMAARMRVRASLCVRVLARGTSDALRESVSSTMEAAAPVSCHGRGGAESPASAPAAPATCTSGKPAAST